MLPNSSIQHDLCRIAGAGFEPATRESEDTAAKALSKAETPDMSSCMSFLRESDRDLADLVDAWPKLSKAVKAGIAALVKASLPE